MRSLFLLIICLSLSQTILNQNANLLINENFSDPPRYFDKAIITSLPGWQITSVEQGTGYLYNTRWPTSKTVIELAATIAMICIILSSPLDPLWSSLMDNRMGTLGNQLSWAKGDITCMQTTLQEKTNLFQHPGQKYT